MRVRLFWQLLATFAFLNVFAIGGTIGLIGAQFRQISSETLPVTLEGMRQTWADPLADYYVAHGESWEGVHRRLEAMLAAQPWVSASSVRYLLLDSNGRPVAQGGARDTDLSTVPQVEGVPIQANGVRVGTLVVLPARQEHEHRWDSWREGRDLPALVQPAAPVPPEAPDRPMPQWTVEQRVGRSFGLVAFGIGSVTLGLAVIVSRRISAPLRRLTRAAQQVAAGDLRVQVPGSSIQEVDALACAFNQMAADLLHEDQLRRNMTADIAHELRTPLTIIKGKLEGILDGVYPGSAEHVAPVLEEADLLERLVEDLRVLSLAEAGQLPLYREEVPVAELLEDVERSFAAEAAQQNVALRVDVAPGVQPVEVDPQRMQQVLGNLVTNSLRYTPGGGRIELRAAQHDGMVRIAA